MVVKEMNIDGCIVRFHDDYIVKDEVEKQRILDRAWAIVDGALLRQAKESGILKEA